MPRQKTNKQKKTLVKAKVNYSVYCREKTPFNWSQLCERFTLRTTQL